MKEEKEGICFLDDCGSCISALDCLHSESYVFKLLLFWFSCYMLPDLKLDPKVDLKLDQYLLEVL